MSEPVAHSTFVEVKEELYNVWQWGIHITVLGAILVTAVIVALPFFSVPLIQWGVVAVLIAYWATSWRPVQTGDNGGIMVLEQPVKEVGPGWYFVPRFIMELETMPAHTEQDQFPADPEKVSKRPDEQGLLPGEYRPIRAMTAGARTEDGEDPLNTRLALEVTFAVRWRLPREGFFDLFVNIPGEHWPQKAAMIRQQMRDTGETELLEEISQMTPYEVVKEQKKINDRLKDQLSKAVKTWGIVIEEARMQAPDFSHEVNTALSDIAVARARKQATITTAEAEKQRLILEGEGTATAQVKLAEATRHEIALKGKGQREAADALGITGEKYFEGDIAKETIGEGDLVLGAEGIAQAMGLGKLISKSGKEEPK